MKDLLSKVLRRGPSDVTFAVRSPYQDWIVEVVNWTTFRYARRNYGGPLEWSKEWDLDAFDNQGPIWEQDPNFTGRPTK